MGYSQALGAPEGAQSVFATAYLADGPGLGTSPHGRRDGGPLVSTCLCLASCPQSPFFLPNWDFPDSQVVSNISSLCSWSSFLHVPFSVSPDSTALQQHLSEPLHIRQELPPGPWPLCKSPVCSSIRFFICEMGMAQPSQEVQRKQGLEDT